MPELPEVETMRRGVLPIVGGRIRDIVLCPCEKKPILVTPSIATFRRRAIDRRIEAVDRLGKRLIVRLAGGDAIVIEPRMTGLALVADPPNTEHLRFRISLSGAKAKELLFWDRRGLGSVRLYSPAEFAKRFQDGQVGPDALQLTAEVLRERLGLSRRAIKVALLDQKAIAGVGNLYASEILHLARIHPGRACAQLRPAAWQRIHVAMQEVLETAIRLEGSTLSDGTYRNALNQAGSYQNHHRVYDRAGDACPSCGRAAILRIVQAQRSTFFCPKCQRK